MSTQHPIVAGPVDLTRISTLNPLEENDTEVLSLLGADHSAWPIDAIILSPRAKTWLATLACFFMPLLGYWDQSIRSLTIAIGEISIDAAGSYRLVP